MPNGTSDPVEEAFAEYRYRCRELEATVAMGERESIREARQNADEAEADLTAALTRKAQQPLLALLREMEWKGAEKDPYGHHHPQCVVCLRFIAEGHTPGCRLGKLLKEVGS